MGGRYRVKGRFFLFWNDSTEKYWIGVVCECDQISISVEWIHSRHLHSADFVNRSANRKSAQLSPSFVVVVDRW